MSSKKWTTEDDLRLKKLKARGTSLKECGETLGRSKAAVVARIHKIKSRGNNQFVKYRGNRGVVTLPQISSCKAADALDKLKANQCRYAIGKTESPDFRFCGAKTEKHNPYCYDHMMIAYKQKEPDEDNA